MSYLLRPSIISFCFQPTGAVCFQSLFHEQGCWQLFLQIASLAETFCKLGQVLLFGLTNKRDTLGLHHVRGRVYGNFEYDLLGLTTVDRYDDGKRN